MVIRVEDPRQGKLLYDGILRCTFIQSYSRFASWLAVPSLRGCILKAWMKNAVRRDANHLQPSPVACPVCTNGLA